MTELDLTTASCVPCRRGVQALDATAAAAYHAQVADWAMCDDGRRLERTLRFKTFAEAFAFIEKVVLIAQSENHHPDLSFGWAYATVSLHTHAIKGLHKNDFIVAAKIDRLLR